MWLLRVDEPAKVCSCCGEPQPLALFGPDKRAKDGLRCACRACMRAQARAYQADPEVKARKAAWHLENRERRVPAMREYGKRTRDIQSARKRARYASDPVVRDAVSVAHKRWAAENPDTVRRASRAYYLGHSDVIKARTRGWKEQNPERHAALRLKQDALRRQRRNHEGAETFTRAEIWERDCGKCHVCGRRCNANDWHLDHLIPLSHGGEHTRQNVAVAHPHCNLTKSASGPAQLRLWGGV